MTKLGRSTLNTNAGTKFPDNYSEDITPEDVRTHVQDLADSTLNLDDEDYYLHPIYNDNRPYVIGDVVYKDGEFYELTSDYTGPWDDTKVTIYFPLKDWSASSVFRIGRYVNYSNNLYKCIVDHTSSSDFTTDKLSGFWVLVGSSEAVSDDAYSAAWDGDTTTPASRNALYDIIQQLERTANKGVANGYASLDSSGLVPSSQLPSYVDDVLEYSGTGSFPLVGESGKIYLDTTTNYQYRWTGSTYVQITSSSAVWGSISGSLASQTDLQAALNAKADDTLVLKKANNLSDLASTVSSQKNLKVSFNEIVAKSANFTILASDEGKVFNVTTGASNILATLDATTLYNGFKVFVRKADTGAGLLTSSASTSAIGKSGHMFEIFCDGSSYIVKTIYGSFDAIGNLTISSVGDINLNTVGALKTNNSNVSLATKVSLYTNYGI